MIDSEKYERVECYRSERVAKMFAQTSNGIYKGWVEENTTFTIKRGDEPITFVSEGCYVVVWE